jgi:uncharacterized protein (DUF2147 family)
MEICDETRFAMKRLLSFAVLMLLSPSAYAGNSFSFVVGGHRIHIEAPSHCDSPSCVSVSIPGIYQTHGRDRSHDDTPQVVAPAAPSPALALAPAPVPVTQPAAVRPAAPPVCQPLPVAATLPPPAPLPAPVTPPIKTSQAETSIDTTRPAPAATAPIVTVSHETDDDLADTPLGDWQTEGHTGSVRIEQCGRALCGYVLDPASNAKGEAVLIDMKPKDSSKDTSKDFSQADASQWSGNIYSRDTGNTYYATIAMKGQNSLQVEACALGHFFCSGNRWSRIDVQPVRLISYRQIASQPKS